MRQLGLLLLVFEMGSLGPRLCGQTAPAVAGQVVDSVKGEPVAAAHLKLTCAGNTQYAATDAKGHFEFAQRPTSACRLATYRPGYSDTQLNVPADADSARAMRLTLVPQAILTGRLTDPNGLPSPTSRYGS